MGKRTGRRVNEMEESVVLLLSLIDEKEHELAKKAIGTICKAMAAEAADKAIDMTVNEVKSKIMEIVSAAKAMEEKDNA